MKATHSIASGTVSAAFALNGSTISLGREISCDVVLNGVGISRRHATIVLESPNPRLLDNGSTFGTRLGDHPVRDVSLFNDAVITIGVVHLRVILEQGKMSLIDIPAPDAGPAVAEAEPDDQTPVDCAVVRIGRDPENEIHCVHPLVSRFHASFVKNDKERPTIIDHQSANGTYVNGMLVRNTQVLKEDDVVQIGPYRFFLENNRLEQVDDYDRVKLEAFDLTVCRGGRRILNGVSLSVNPGEFVAILGPSGAGKTTLGRVLMGQVSPDGGQVFMNGLPLQQFYRAFMSTIGYVSQHNILHPELTVGETFHEHSILRLPADSIPAERQKRIADVLELLEITHLKNRQVRRLSGGEAKRVHLGIELLASPAVILLDEPLAGLDFSLIRTFMGVFRKICDKGHTVLLTTHTLEDINLCDRMLFVKNGRIDFDGPPDAVVERFGVSSIADLYDSARVSTASQVAAATGSQDAAAPVVTTAASRMAEPRIKKSASLMRQLPLLLMRYLRIMTRDPKNMLVIFSQVPLITALLACVFDRNADFLPISFYFCVTVSSIWIGGINAIREIVRERDVIAREYRAGLSLTAYGISKIVTLLLLAVVQSVLFWGLLSLIFEPFSIHISSLLLLGAGTIGGVLLGLCISSFSSSLAMAISWLPLVLIPQVFFSGILTPLDTMPVIGRILTWLTVSRPVFALFKKSCVLELGIWSPVEWFALATLMAGLIIFSFAGMRLAAARNRG